MGRGPEARFQDGLHKRLYAMFPGCKIFKMDQHQGIPDLLVLWRDKWALLECKAWTKAHKQPIGSRQRKKEKKKQSTVKSLGSRIYLGFIRL